MLGVAIRIFCIKNPRKDMSSSSPDHPQLLIRCPSCRQRFRVGEDLLDRTVECGGCEHRFRINGDVIVRGRKFYPSENKNESLNQFPRIPLPGGESMIGMQPVRYSTVPDPALLEPISPQRVIAGVIGVLGMALIALFLMFGASRGGALDGMVMSSRFLVAGFGCLMGVLLLVYANPRARKKALLIGLLLSVGLLAVPYFFRGGSVVLPKRVESAQTEPQPPVEESGTQVIPEASEITDLRTRIGTGPLVTEIQRLATEGSRYQAMGIWLRGLSDSHKFLVRDYILRVTGADASSHFYPRSGGDYLLVLSGMQISLQELAAMVTPLGKVEKIYPEISVIEVRVREEIFIEGSIEKLSKKEDPAFYDLNKRELESIDLQRVKRAVQRLAEAEPKLYRIDISRKLIALLGDDAVDFKGNVCSALVVWSDQPGPASDAALIALKKLMVQGKPVPQEMIALMVHEKNSAVIPILDELWMKTPMTWESYYADFGSEIEATVIRRFPETKGTVRYSAVRILGRVGGVDSLSLLTPETTAGDSELRVLIEQAKKSIRTRLGQ
jgi:hypothetical protein